MRERYFATGQTVTAADVQLIGTGQVDMSDLFRQFGILARQECNDVDASDCFRQAFDVAERMGDGGEPWTAFVGENDSDPTKVRSRGLASIPCM
ncbi:hypothetical protein B8W69_11855 [Mycobacterium vulneris]|jgi:hypothetical protein|uniref:Uncharacterized protein n=1 Tax=Mycolicibacterium vulneris TaxID=547163 RepID=A0A1X2L3I3_9MYCO|nr:hypothetical protein B8W69_11855 [Mycolicibacterium vulneris]